MSESQEARNEVERLRAEKSAASACACLGLCRSGPCPARRSAEARFDGPLLEARLRVLRLNREGTR